MTRHTKVDVNPIIIKETCRLLDKSDIIKIIENSFSKKDLIHSIVNIWELRDLSTNNKIENYFNRNVLKNMKEDESN